MVKIVLFDGSPMDLQESMSPTEGVFYHGTDARIVQMSEHKRQSFTKERNEALSFMWTFFEPYIYKTDDLRKYFEDEIIWQNFYSALVRYNSMKTGNSQYQYGAFYLSNFKQRAAEYALRSFAFGELGLNAIHMLCGAERIKFKDWHPSEAMQLIFNNIHNFAEEPSQPVIYAFNDIDTNYLYDETGEKITKENRDVFLSSSGSFRYTKGINLSQKTPIKISTFNL